MRAIYWFMVIVAIISVVLFIPIYIVENTVGNYLLAGFIITEFLIFLISRWLETPNLVSEVGDPLKSEYETYHTLLIINRGKRGAEGCEGKLTLDITPDDIVEGYGGFLNKASFRPLKKMNVCWSKWIDGNPREVSIKAKGSESLEVVKVVKEHRKTVDGLHYTVIPLHFEIPSEKGWKPIRVALAPKTYEGSIRIECMNGEPNPRKLRIEFNGKDDVTLKLLDC